MIIDAARPPKGSVGWSIKLVLAERKLFGVRFTARAARLVVSVCASPCIAFKNVILDVGERLVGVSLEVNLKALRADWIPECCIQLSCWNVSNEDITVVGGV